MEVYPYYYSPAARNPSLFSSARFAARDLVDLIDFAACAGVGSRLIFFSFLLLALRAHEIL